MEQEPKDLIGNDIFLNLEEIAIWSQDGTSSRSANVNANFYFKCETEHGYMEDPNLDGITLEVLNISKNTDGTFDFKVKMTKNFHFEEK